MHWPKWWRKVFWKKTPRIKHLRRTHQAKISSEHRETRIELQAGRMPADVDGQPSAWVEKNGNIRPDELFNRTLTQLIFVIGTQHDCVVTLADIAPQFSSGWRRTFLSRWRGARRVQSPAGQRSHSRTRADGLAAEHAPRSWRE